MNVSDIIGVSAGIIILVLAAIYERLGRVLRELETLNMLDEDKIFVQRARQNVRKRGL